MTLGALPRVLDAAGVRSLVTGAGELHQPLSLFLGLPLDPGAISPLSGREYLGHLVPLARGAPARLYLGLYTGKLPDSETLDRLPPNLSLFVGGIPELVAAAGGNFAAEAISIGGVRVEAFDDETLLALRDLLAPDAPLYVYLFAEPGSNSLEALQKRLSRFGFGEIETREIGRNESKSLIPDWPRPLRTVVSARARKNDLPPADEKDPFVIGLRQVLEKGDPDEKWVLAIGSAWLREGFPAPLRRPMKDHPVVSFGRGFLSQYPETDGRRNSLARRAERAVAALVPLFEIPPPEGRRWKASFLQALAREYPSHHKKPSYNDLWRWLGWITDVSPRKLRGKYERDLMVVAAEIFPHPNQELDAVVGKMLDRTMEKEREVTPSEVWRRLERKTGMDQEALKGRFYYVVTAWLWKNWSRLGERPRRNLAESLPDDRDELRAVGYEPPFDYLTWEEKIEKLGAALLEIFRDWKSPLIPYGETVRTLHGLLWKRGVFFLQPQLESFLVYVAGALWEGVDKGVIDRRFLERKNIERPSAAPPPPPSSSPASSPPPSLPPKVVEPPPPPSEVAPPAPALSTLAQWRCEVAAHLARQGR